MRQIVIDTETTGLNFKEGHRVIEIGCVEMINRRLTGKNFHYYLNPERGAIPEWSADKFAVMSWENWLTFDPMPSAKKLASPVLMIHSDGCVLPEYTKKYYNEISSEQKKLHYIESSIQSPMEQFDFYDNDEKVNMAVNLSGEWYKKHL